MTYWMNLLGLFGNKKWQILFVYQLLFPFLAVLTIGVILGVFSGDVHEGLFYMGVDGELLLISIFLVVAVAIEAPAKHSFMKLLGPVYSFVATMFYTANKLFVYCPSCYNGASLSGAEGMFLWINVGFIIVTPLFCCAILASTTHS